MVHPGPIDTPLFAQASSGTGLQPRVPPDADVAGVVAQALVEVTVKPRPRCPRRRDPPARPDVLVHRPLAEGILLLIDRWYRSGTERRPPRLPLGRPPGQPAASRPANSLFAPLQLGRRMWPAAVTPLRFAAHRASAAGKVPGIARQLSAPVAERAAPGVSLGPEARGRGGGAPGAGGVREPLRPTETVRTTCDPSIPATRPHRIGWTAGRRGRHSVADRINIHAEGAARPRATPCRRAAMAPATTK